MSLRTVSAVLPMLLLAGCWPYLGSPYEDYVDGEGTTDPDVDTDTLPDRGTDDPDTDDPDTAEVGDGGTLFGAVTNIQLLGGYWGQDADLSLQSGLIGVTDAGLDWEYASVWPAPGECGAGNTLADEASSLAMDVGLASTISLNISNRSLPLEVWDTNADVRTGNNEVGAAFPVNTDVVLMTGIDAGQISGTISRTPGDFSWTEPLVDGAQMVLLPRTPFNVVWSGTGQDTVIATWLFQDANFQTVGGAICNVPPGGFSINPADAPANTEFIALSLERIREFSASVPGSAGVSSEVAGTIEKRGYIALEAAAE